MTKKRDVIEHIRQFASDPIRYRPGVTSTLTLGPEECDQILAAIGDDPPRPAYRPPRGEVIFLWVCLAAMFLAMVVSLTVVFLRTP